MTEELARPNRRHPTTAPRHNFEYAPLASKDTIRLLHIDGTSINTPTLSCTIYHAQRSTAATDTSWTAISYRWGDPSDLVPIDLKHAMSDGIDGLLADDSKEYQSLNIPRSALETLQALHHQGCIVGKKVWIDAICINQVDLAEKSAQVSAMGDIYKLAARTIVFVGPSLPSTERAIRFMSTLEAYFDSLETSESRKGSKDFSFQDLFDATSSSRDSEDWLALRAHVARPWFNRTWIIQEAVLSTELHFIWGHFSLPWGCLEKLCHHESKFKYGLLLYQNDSFARKALSAMKNIQKLKSNRAGFSRGWSCNISFALYCCFESSASDPRDKVYGLLGLLQTHDPNLDVKILPDYLKAASTVYTEVTRDFTLKNDSFDLIYSAGIGRTRNIEGHPSWVPDLSLPLPIYPFPTHRAGKGPVTNLLPLQFEHNAMIVQAFVVDSVRSVAGRVVEDPSATSTLDIENDPQVIDHLQGAVDLMKAVHVGFWSDSVFGTFVRTVVADIDAYLDRAPKEYCTVCESLPVIHRNGVRFPQATAPNSSKHDRDTYLTAVAVFIKDNIFCMAVKNSLGIVPRFTREGDLVCVCPGSRMPFVIRPTGLSQTGKEVFQLVGYGFFLSLNNGEGLEVGPLHHIVLQ